MCAPRWKWTAITSIGRMQCRQQHICIVLAAGRRAALHASGAHVPPASRILRVRIEGKTLAGTNTDRMLVASISACVSVGGGACPNSNPVIIAVEKRHAQSDHHTFLGHVSLYASGSNAIQRGEKTARENSSSPNYDSRACHRVTDLDMLSHCRLHHAVAPVARHLCSPNN